MTDLLLRNALVLAGSGPSLRVERADLAIEGTRIAALGAPGSLPGAAREIDCARLLVAPGLVNGHYHSWDQYQKGCIDGLPLEPFMAYLRPPKPVPLTPRHVYLRTMLGAIEALRTGATLIVDDLSLGTSISREHLEAVFSAYADSGIRAMVGFSMIDRAIVESFPFVEECFSAAEIAALKALPRPDGAGLLDLVRELAATRNPRSARVGVIVAPSAPQRCTDGFLRACRALADEHDLPVMIHVQETRMQVVTGQLRHGRTMIEHLHALGFLRPRTALVHGVWLSPRDIELIAASGASVQHNPWSNLTIGSGVAPVRAMLAGGIPVSLGSDGMSSTYTCSMLNVLGAAAALGKVRDPDPARWLTAREVWDMGTRAGAHALGLADRLGEIAPGMTADLVGYRLDRAHFTPLNDPVTQLVYAERGSSVDLVVVDGRLAMQAGMLTSVDEGALLAEASAVHAGLKPLIDEANTASEPLRDRLLAVYRRSLAEPLAQPTYPAWLEGPPGDRRPTT